MMGDYCEQHSSYSCLHLRQPAAAADNPILRARRLRAVPTPAPDAPAPPPPAPARLTLPTVRPSSASEEVIDCSALDLESYARFLAAKTEPRMEIEWAQGVWTGINESYTLNTSWAKGEDDVKHICPMNLEVIDRCVRMYSAPGEIVLDPFNGIGSTGVVSMARGRRYIGIELKPEYFLDAAKNIQAAADAGLPPIHELRKTVADRRKTKAPSARAKKARAKAGLPTENYDALAAAEAAAEA